MALTEKDDRSAAIRSQAEIHAKIAHLYSLDRVERTVFNRAFNAYWNRMALAMFPPDRDVRILDLMGGTGILSRAIQAEGYGNLTLLDLSLDMLRFAQSSLGGVRRLCSADAMRLPYRDETFDLVVCRGGLHHLPDLPAAVSEIERVLRKNGTFLAFDPCDDLLLVRGARRLMYRVFNFFDDEHERGLATREVTTVLTTAGFDTVDVKRFGFVGYLASGIEAHLFPRLFERLPRLDGAAEWLCRIDERLEGSSFLLAAAYRAVKGSGAEA